MKKGYTLLEILITILIISIISALAITSYREFIRDTFSETVGMRREMDFKTLLLYLRKIIGSTGFGIPVTDLKKWSPSFCNGFIAFANETTSAVIGLALNCNETGGNDELYLRSAYVSDTRFSGCWWVNNLTQGFDRRLIECNFQSAENGTCIALGTGREFLGINTCKIFNNTQGFIYYLHNTDSQAYPRRVSLRLYLDNATTPSECAPESYSLYRETLNLKQPLFDCIGGMKFSEIIGSYELPSGLRVCLLVQVSGRSRNRIAPPQSSNCGNFTIKNGWEYYRWRIVEEIIPFKNL
ncbi:MAG: prepilin-type N-terminal cleavage/methylation domain-containing protein [Thermodesulfobacteriaceae bacterium]|nr:prepilin-type N-terminal cleavage/methylation domain-containing protein [Thermodesulfobacteriaceae bacterium]